MGASAKKIDGVVASRETISIYLVLNGNIFFFDLGFFFFRHLSHKKKVSESSICFTVIKVGA